MKRWLLLTVLLLSTFPGWAGTKEFVRDYTYIVGEADSKISARQMAMQEVKLELLNELGIYIYSRIDVSENSKGETVAKQDIRAMTAGFVKVEVLEERWNGYVFYIKAKMVANPEEILDRIKDLASKNVEKIKLKEQLNQSVIEFNSLRLEMLALKSALIESKSDNEKQKLALEYAQKSKDLSVKEIFEKGNDYRWGRKGLSIDNRKAVMYFQEAAHRGNVEAQIELAMSYWSGNGIKSDNDKSYYWIQKAVDQNSNVAFVLLQLMVATDKVE
jgi:predicted DNA-binding transcriptional regulator